MLMTEGRRRSLIALMLAHAIALVASAADQTPPSVPLRSRVVLVPVDVRVVDQHGVPVTDLTRSDFTVFDNDVQQDISHFLKLSRGRPWEDDVSPLTSAIADHRVFGIVLGRGRLNVPGKTIDALIEFVQTRLLPSDAVSVIMYGRATDFSAERESIVRLLKRYRDRHETIETLLTRDFKSRLVLKGTLSADTQALIDEVFVAPGLPKQIDLPGSVGKSPSLDFELLQLVNSIEYLGQVKGEKHLIFVNEGDSAIGTGSDPEHFVRLAANSRIVLSIIQTGNDQQPVSMDEGLFRAPSSMRVVAGPSSARFVAEQTGGVACIAESGDQAVGRIERAADFQYLLGFYPTARGPDGYGRIRVTVRRPGVKLAYRHSYNRSAEPTEPVGLRDLFAEASIRRAFTYLRGPTFDDSPYPGRNVLKVTTSVAKQPGNQVKVTVDLRFDPSRATFVQAGASYKASLDVALVAVDSNEVVLAERRERMILDLSSAEYERAKRDWLQLSMTLSMPHPPVTIRAVLFDYDAGRTFAGTSNVRSRSR